MRKLVVGLHYLAVWRKARDEISPCTVPEEGEVGERECWPDGDRSYLAETVSGRGTTSNTVIKLPESLARMLQSR